VSNQIACAVTSLGPQKPNAAPTTQHLTTADHGALPDGRNELHVEIQRRTGTSKSMQQVSHRNVEGGGEDSAVQRTLRIEQEVVYSECYLANVLGVGDLKPEQSGEEEVTECLPLTACGALERRVCRGEVDRPATGRTSHRHIIVFDRTFQTFGFVHSFLLKKPWLNVTISRLFKST
jgi:hypothetical protein